MGWGRLHWWGGGPLEAPWAGLGPAALLATSLVLALGFCLGMCGQVCGGSGKVSLVFWLEGKAALFSSVGQPLSAPSCSAGRTSVLWQADAGNAPLGAFL